MEKESKLELLVKDLLQWFYTMTAALAMSETKARGAMNLQVFTGFCVLLLEDSS